MKSLLLMLTVLAIPAAVQAEPLRPMSACLDPNRARSWHLIDAKQMLVDAGRHKFHLTLAPACTDLNYTYSVVFRSNDGIGRICGDVGDRVLVERRTPVPFPCHIVKVTPLTKEEYQARLDDKPAQGKVTVREEQSHEEPAQR